MTDLERERAVLETALRYHDAKSDGVSDAWLAFEEAVRKLREAQKEQTA